MEFLKPVIERIPDYAKDIRLNLGNVLSRTSLDRVEALGVAPSAAHMAGCKPLTDALRNSGHLTDAEARGAPSCA